MNEKRIPFKSIGSQHLFFISLHPWKMNILNLYSKDGGYFMKYLSIVLLSLVLASCFMYYEYKKLYKTAVLLKALASLSFILFGLLSATQCNDPVFARRIIIGLILGGIADVLLNLRFVFPNRGKKIFLVGILVFLSGHLLYLAALIPYSTSLVLWLGIGTVLTVLVLLWIFSKITVAMAFKIFGILYIGAIMLMNSVAAGILINTHSTHSVVFFIGALLFLISDIVLILNTFGPKQKQKLRVTNLSLYYVGQLLIGLSLQLLR
jgi:uncharacterized membrane protein YhhN